MMDAKLSIVTALVIATAAPAAVAAGPASAQHARGAGGVFWFMHVSDLHVGAVKIAYPNAAKHVELAFTQAVSVIQPKFVAATGDLCDGSKNDIPTSGQDQAEWDLYKQLYVQAGFDDTFFFDLPGNHDGYGDIGLKFYLANSMQGQANNATHAFWTVDIPMGEYLFLGMNSAGDGSGPAFEDAEFPADMIAEAAAAVLDHASAQLVFGLAHHRLSQPKNSGQVIDLLNSVGGGFYMHGHVHEYDEYLEGDGWIVVNEIDSLGKGDDNNIGVVAVDHNAVIYRATSTGKPWPMVMITAPVDRNLRSGVKNPYAYRVCKDRQDNPVRALVFAKDSVSEVKAQIGTAPAATMVASDASGLWEGEIDTSALTAGTHDVTVTATVGSEVAFHKIAAEFFAGPCDPLPNYETPDAGPSDGGQGGADAGDSGAGGSGGSTAGGSGGGSSVDGGTGGSILEDDAGGEMFEELEATPDSAGGCGCRQAPSNVGSAWSALLAGVIALVFRRKRKVR